MKRIFTFCLLIFAFSIGFAQAETDTKQTPEVKPEPTKSQKLLTPEQIARLKQAQDVREKAELRLAVVRSELGRIEAEIAALVRLIALEQKINMDEFEIDLSQVSDGVVGFKPKPPPKEPEKKPEKED